MRLRYENRRTLVTLSGPVRLRLRIRRCEAPGCPRFHVPFRPEAEGALALPQHEFGLDVVALVGVLRHRDHRSVPEVHAALRGRGWRAGRTRPWRSCGPGRWRGTGCGSASR